MEVPWLQVIRGKVAVAFCFGESPRPWFTKKCAFGRETQGSHRMTPEKPKRTLLGGAWPRRGHNSMREKFEIGSGEKKRDPPFTTLRTLLPPSPPPPHHHHPSTSGCPPTFATTLGPQPQPPLMSQHPTALQTRAPHHPPGPHAPTHVGPKMFATQKKQLSPIEMRNKQSDQVELGPSGIGLTSEEDPVAVPNCLLVFFFSENNHH